MLQNDKRKNNKSTQIKTIYNNIQQYARAD